MRISACTIKNFKRLRDVAITPDADRTVILIGGKNGAGKSSVLDALSSAFGGKDAMPDQPVRHGAELAEIRVELDGGAMTIRRMIHPTGETTLEVRDAEGRIRSPQAVLDKIVGERFLDPLAYLQLSPREQRAELMKLVPEAERIRTLNEKRVRVFDSRTEISRELTRAEGELARLPVVEVGTAIDVAKLSDERASIGEELRAVDAQRAEAKAAAEKHRAAIGVMAALKQDAATIEDRIKDLEAKLARKREAMSEQADAVLAAERLATDAADAAAITERHQREKLDPRRAELDADLARANAHNKSVFEAEAQNRRRADADAAVAKLTAERDKLTATIGEIDRRKAEVLAAAKLPVAGLAVTDDAITLNGVPLEQASGAEQLRVALALAIAASPNLHDVWVKDGSLLDDDSLELLATEAAKAGTRVWVERVGDRDPGAIVIHDGQVREQKADAA